MRFFDNKTSTYFSSQPLNITWQSKFNISVNQHNIFSNEKKLELNKIQRLYRPVIPTYHNMFFIKTHYRISHDVT